MNLKEETIRKAATLVCTAETQEDAIKIFTEYQMLLHNCRFIFASSNGAIPGLSINHNFSATGVIRSLFKTDKVWLLDRTTLKEMYAQGCATFPIDYSISLDTQALSYLEPYINDTSNRVPADFTEVFEFLARTDVNVDPMPYLYENLFKKASDVDFDKIFSKYRAYEILRSLDLEHLHTNKQIRSNLSHEHLNIQTQKNLAKIMYDIDDHVKEHLNLRVDFYYCILLKIAIIHFYRPKLTVVQKMEKLLDFMDTELTTICIRELIIAYEFFKHDTKIKFFGKIQNNNEDILQDLRNMAWDFFHIRQLEENSTIKCNEARYFFSSLLTFDKKFIQIIDLCPLKCIAYLDGIKQPIPFYDDNAMNAFNSFINEHTELNQRFFSNKAMISRSNRRKKRYSLKNLIDKLEIEISQYYISLAI